MTSWVTVYLPPPPSVRHKPEKPWHRLKRVIRQYLDSRRKASVPSQPLTPQTPIPFDLPPPDPAHNSARPVNRLPEELLTEIFVLVCEDAHIGDYSWVNTSHVCRLWRQIAVAAPGIWRNVILRSDAWMQRCLERAKSALLIMNERIEQIHIRCSYVSSELSSALRKPFPHLKELTMFSTINYNRSVVSSFEAPASLKDGGNHPKLQRFNLSPRLLIDVFPPPPSLVHLELTGLLLWDALVDLLAPLHSLKVLGLESAPSPPLRDQTAIRRILLPALTELTLGTHSAESASAFLRSATLPSLTTCEFALAVPLGIHHLLADHAALYFCGRDFTTTLSSEVHDVVIRWQKQSLTTQELGLIFSALCGTGEDRGREHFLARLRWFHVENWGISPPEAWAALLAKMGNLRMLVMYASATSGLLWALIRREKEKLVAGELEVSELLPHLTSMFILSTDLNYGGWLAAPSPPNALPAPSSSDPEADTSGGSTINSYYEQDGARFIEVLTRYLELRHERNASLRRLKIASCASITGIEVKYLKRLIPPGGFLWDGRGTVQPRYDSNGDNATLDRFTGLGINHALLAEEPGYEEVTMSGEEWYQVQYKEFWRYARAEKDGETSKIQA
ncbi:F-box domain-containing protein [Mycena kentingensis (nom. inval.)]|nr:F-box domain-containing protein [Mycena kentingensis (nom. inval.)]